MKQVRILFKGAHFFVQLIDWNRREQGHFFFYDWDEDADMVRWTCSFDTTEEDIANFIAALKRRLG